MADNDNPFVNIPTEEPTISPDTEPSMFERVSNQAWFGWAIRLIVALILIAIIFFGARWIHNRSHHAVNNPRGANTATPPSQPNGSSPTTKNNSPNSSSSSGSSAANASNAGSAGSGKGPGTTNQQIVNTGPGDVIAVFAATTAGAASLHYVVSKRREA